MEPLGELEIEVMKAVWAGPPATVREITDRMRGRVDRAYTTVMTTLERLHRKGHLDRVKEGLAWRYSARFDAAGYERALADSLAAELLERPDDAGVLAFLDAA